MTAIARLDALRRNLVAGHSTGTKEHYVVIRSVQLACEATERGGHAMHTKLGSIVALAALFAATCMAADFKPIVPEPTYNHDRFRT